MALVKWHAAIAISFVYISILTFCPYNPLVSLGISLIHINKNQHLLLLGNLPLAIDTPLFNTKVDVTCKDTGVRIL